MRPSMRPSTVHDQMETEQLDAMMDTVEEPEPLSMDASCQTDWSIPASSLMTKTDASCQVRNFLSLLKNCQVHKPLTNGMIIEKILERFDCRFYRRGFELNILT